MRLCERKSKALEIKRKALAHFFFIFHSSKPFPPLMACVKLDA